MAVAIYPGSFDPPTNGHLNVVERGSRLFDRLIVAVLRNGQKQPLFTVAERMEMLQEMTAPLGNVEVGTFGGLLVEFAVSAGASVILRGLRSPADFEWEEQMAALNRQLRPDLETVFLTASGANRVIRSQMVKEIASLGGDVSGLVPAGVAKRLRGKYVAR